MIYEALMKMRTEKSYAVSNSEETYGASEKDIQTIFSKTQEVNPK